MSIESNKIMNLADGKVLYDDLRGRSDHNKDMIAPEFAEATANNAGTYVTHDGGLYYLPDGHTANTTWLNTTKTAVTIGGELSSQNGAIGVTQTEENLLRSEMPGTSTTVTMDSNGNPTSIVHTANSATVRTDSFVWGTGTVTETRTLANGKYITITTDLDTLAQTISAVQEVA